MSRDENRRQERLSRSRVERQIKHGTGLDWWRENPKAMHMQIVKRAVTPRMCSCVMCGNPRWYSKGNEALTRAEIRANIMEREMREEVE